eukprot:210327-Amphidinium_carterae.1
MKGCCKEVRDVRKYPEGLALNVQCEGLADWSVSSKKDKMKGAWESGFGKKSEGGPASGKNVRVVKTDNRNQGGG